MSKLGKTLECWFGLCDHDWTKWVERPSTAHYYLTGASHGITVQTRACKKCGHTVVKRLEEV